ncbi:hypothetical protein C8A05DRAFT_32626 [Staphylotrichum tortipilum]|uniref:Uncharacterized protein n=1 Tax=Staphylotrichum tortipilum TaxID=2831512 RepID=A0AAN6MNU1_9PEZI|nr:hypothetical protein C8A05DRAFT_32626 [Staphylotrichum longicolle]
MRSIWSCSSCAALLLAALLGREASASHAGKGGNHVHRVRKAQVTPAAAAHPVLARRDEGGSCPAEYSACAASLSGGCCPSRYACAADSCYATTAGPTTACGKSAYFACAPVNGQAGCCPVGYVCGNGGDCLPPSGVTYTNMQCPNDYYLCPSSFNYGCCQSGMGCAPNGCYSTNPVTTTLVQIATTTSGTRAITNTRTTVTVATPTPPSGLPDSSDVAAKFIPTSVPKVPVSSPTSDPSPGLSPGAIGGIIAGVVVLLIVVVVAAFLIIHRLKRVEKGLTDPKPNSSSGHRSRSHAAQAQMEQYGRQLHSDLDDMSVDPLMVAPNPTTNPSSAAGTPAPRGRADSAPSPHNPNPNPNYYTDDRYASPDPNGGYFDIPPRAHNLPGGGSLAQQPMQAAHIRDSADSSVSAAAHRRGYRYHHWRQQSNASELSADGSDHGGNANVHSPLVDGAPPTGGVIQELDGAEQFVDNPARGSYGYSQQGQRSRANSGASAGGGGHVRGRSDAGGGGSGGGAGLAGLGTLQEGAEIQVHGYYGRRDQQAGQTAAGLDVEWDVSGGFQPGNGGNHGQEQR